MKQISIPCTMAKELSVTRDFKEVFAGISSSFAAISSSGGLVSMAPGTGAAGTGLLSKSSIELDSFGD